MPSNQAVLNLKVLLVFIVGVVYLEGCAFYTVQPSASYATYRVARGDTIYSLSRRFGVSPKEILAANDISDPTKLKIGSVLRIRRQSGTVGDTAPDKNSVKMVKLTTARKFVGKLAWPVAGGSITSRFGRRWLSFHEGIDISAESGTPIRAAHDGEVVYSGDRIRGYGNMVVLRGDGIMTVYGHNRINRVRVGERVQHGERIADVGATGKASGPHLHFETRVMNVPGKNIAVDPLAFYRS